MKKSIFAISWLLLGVVLFSFKGDVAYENQIKEWHKKRVEGLKAEDGWLNLAGLFWLEEGVNTFGGSSENDIIFPKDHSKAALGKIILENGTVTLETAKDAEIFNGTEPVEKITLFPYQKPVVVKHQSLRWFIIKRGDKYAVRLRDLESQALKDFKGIDTYPINENWKVKAKLEKSEGKKVAITDITGRLSEEDSPGTLVFIVKGKEYRLDAVGTEENLFIIFGDETNKKETYGAGRFVYASEKAEDGSYWLDFNKATNPPCAFSPYATCPLPPKQNKLTVAITAGEKRFGEH
ncbi:MAG TPA: DUF1684 domain-containing protein [Dyadobacter sp.]|jgi:hypothetical protein|nr:DUF1684 domain-containing protein [Dyadobacter sp.]